MERVTPRSVVRQLIPRQCGAQRNILYIILFIYLFSCDHLDIYISMYPIFLYFKSSILLLFNTLFSIFEKDYVINIGYLVSKNQRLICSFISQFQVSSGQKLLGISCKRSIEPSGFINCDISLHLLMRAIRVGLPYN